MATKTNTTINGHEYFRITRTIGHKIVDGKRIPIKKQFLGRSKTEAERKYQEWKEEQIRKEYEQKIALDSATLGERAEDYIENVLSVSQKYATGTKARYEQAYRTYIEDTYLSDMVLQDIKALDVQKFYNSLMFYMCLFCRAKVVKKSLMKWTPHGSPLHSHFHRYKEAHF